VAEFDVLKAPWTLRRLVT